jgi:hypothetical protein
LNHRPAKKSETLIVPFFVRIGIEKVFLFPNGIIGIPAKISVGDSRPGVPGPTSEMSLRAPAQMGRREAEREGRKKGGRRRA